MIRVIELIEFMAIIVGVFAFLIGTPMLAAWIIHLLLS